jgi:hypothetical protein
MNVANRIEAALSLGCVKLKTQVGEKLAKDFIMSL